MVELVGLVDSKVNVRQELATQWHVPQAATLEEALDWQPDAVIIATPPEITPILGQQALKLGLHVLCEKPMAVDEKTAEAFHAAAEASGKIVQVGFVNRFAPLIRQAKDWVDAGRLGSPLVFRMAAFDERLDINDKTHTERIYHFLEHGPSFVHEAAHHTDYVFNLGGGKPARINAMGIRTDPSFPSENYVAAMVEYDNGDVAKFEVGWLFPALPEGEFIVLGPNGKIVVSRRNNYATLTDQSGELRIEAPEDWVSTSFERQLASFVGSIVTNTPAAPGTTEGLASLRLCLDVAKALRSPQRGHACDSTH